MSVIRCLLTVAMNVKTATPPVISSGVEKSPGGQFPAAMNPIAATSPFKLRRSRHHNLRPKGPSPPLSEANTTLLHNLRRQPRPLLKLRRSRHNNPRAKGPSNLRTFRTKAGQSLEPCQYPPRRVLTTAFIHDNVDISVENDEEKSSHTENGEASPESGSGYG